MEDGDLSAPSEGMFGSSGESRITPVNAVWEELIYSKIGVQVYEHSGSKPSPHSTFKLRYDFIAVKIVFPDQHCRKLMSGCSFEYVWL